MAKGGKRNGSGAKSKNGFVLTNDGIRVTFRVTPEMALRLKQINAQALMTNLLNKHFGDNDET